MTSGNFSTFNRKGKELMNFWVEALVANKDSEENRNESGITVEILCEIPNQIEKSNFVFQIPYLEVPTLGQIGKYKEYHEIWGEDKDLYYNIYYDGHVDIENAEIRVNKVKKEYEIELKGTFDDSFHGGIQNTLVKVNVMSKLEIRHKGFWTK